MQFSGKYAAWRQDTPDLTEIGEFAKTYKKTRRDEQIKRIKDEMAQGSKVTVGSFLNGRLVTVTSTSAENSESAMVVGVATVKEQSRSKRTGHQSCSAAELNAPWCIGIATFAALSIPVLPR